MRTILHAGYGSYNTLETELTNLELESVWNYEISFNQSVLGRLWYGINVFYISGKNLVTTVSRKDATPLNMNTGRQIIRGENLLAQHYEINAG